MFDNAAFAQGFVLGLGMFICPGPKDVLILRQALLQRSAIGLVAVGVLSDVLLIGVGMAGASAAMAQAPSAQTAALWLGVCLLMGHGLMAARRALFFPTAALPAPPNQETLSGHSGLAAVLAVSLLNPVAWLDTLLVIGGVGAAMPESRQLHFGLGACTASLAWFSLIVAGARTAGRWLENPAALRALDLVVAAAMSGMGLYLAASL